MKLIIEKQSTDYSLTFSAERFESDNMTVSEESVKRLRKSTGYLESFLLHKESHRFVTHFVAYGSELYRVFLSSFRDVVKWLSQSQSSTMPSFIVIETTDHAVSSLAWELLYAPEQGFLAESPYFQIVRTTGTDGAPERPLSPGPVRLLFMACSPDGTEPLLNYEREEEIILDAVSNLKKKKGLHIDIAETGTLEELTSLIREQDYHVVHISGHGVYDESRNTGYLLMEKESGMERRVSAHELAGALIGCESLRLLFLSACESGREKEPDTGLARLLISQGVPMVIGMTHSVREYAATSMAETFYRNLTAKQSVAFSLKMARKEFAEKYKATFQWAIPALFTHSQDTDLLDWKSPPEPVQEKEPPAILYGPKIKHLKSGFKGRRREIREHLKMLRQGTPPALCITGSGGIGKSTLASKLTDRLRNSGYIVIPLFGEITPDRFIEKTLKALVSHKEREHLDYMKELLDYEYKIEYILSNVLGTQDIIYFFDNFEDNLKRSAHFKEFKNEFWQESFTYIMELLPDTSSRIIITSRYRIPGLRDALIHHAPLKEMSGPEARKLMIFNHDYSGIEEKQIKEVYSTLGGSPKAIEELGKLLSHTDKSWESIKERLEAVKESMREFTLFKELYSFLSPREQSFFRRISVYQDAVGREALELQGSDNAEKEIQHLVDYSLLQEYEDIAYNKKYYQVHPLNRSHIKANWWQEGEEERSHFIAAQYYLSNKKGLTVDTLSQSAYHLRLAKKYIEMAELIAGSSKEMIVRGFWDEALTLYNLMVEEKEGVGKEFEAFAYNEIGSIYDKKGEWDKALEYYLKSEKISIEVGDRAGLGSTYNNMGLIYSNKGEWDKALEYYLKSEKIKKEVGDRAGLAVTYFNIGTMEIQRKHNIDTNIDTDMDTDIDTDKYLILAGFIAVVQGMKYELSQMAWALEPVINEIGMEKFMETGKRLYEERGL